MYVDFIMSQIETVDLCKKKNWVQFEPTEPNLLAGQSNPHEIVCRDYGETFCKL